MKMWGGRFDRPMGERMKEFNSSLSFDRRLWAADVAGSMAYAGALRQAGLITEEEKAQLTNGLAQVREEFRDGHFAFDPDDEDIHTAVERRLGELVGPAAGKLHTGRSRNDQVATDLRLYLMEVCGQLSDQLRGLQAVIVAKAEQHLGLIMPGYTHLQPAQPILFSHWLLSFFWKFQRDQERLAGLMTRLPVLPLGSGALAGNPFEIDRSTLAQELGFVALSENSLDAVSDRDFVVEFLAWAALLQVHLSGLAEDLVLWSSQEFGFVRLDDAYCTGSSLMPQKRNPDSLELVRGKSGRMVAHLTGLLVTLKGLPSGYNKDLQEDKEPVFDAADTLCVELSLVAEVLRTLNVEQQRVEAALSEGMLATELADYLVSRGVPFRESHHATGQVVRRAEELGVSLSELDLADYRAIHTAFAEDVKTALDFRRCVNRRKVRGGTAEDAVQAQLMRAKGLLSQATGFRRSESGPREELTGA